MWLSASLFLIYVMLTSYSAVATCTYDFSGGNDIIILTDNSGSVSDGNIRDIKDYLRLLIRKRILIGPEINRSRLTFMTFYANSYRITGPDYIANPAPIYESEFLAPGGVFDVKIRRTKESPDIDGTDPGIVGAISACSRLFAKYGDATRRKIVFLLTDFHFDSRNKEKDIVRVTDVMTTLRQTVTSLGQSLQLYGVGIGGYFNQANMATIVAAGNGDSGAKCGKRINDWWTYLYQAGTLKIKKSLGPRRLFSDPSLCCTLCHEQDAERTYAGCSLEEFRSDFSWDDLVIPARVPLQCTSTGQADQCKAPRGGYTTRPVFTERPEGPEGPEGPDEPAEPIDPNRPGDPGSDKERDHHVTSDATFSALAVIFALVNLVLVIAFILVCVYAHKLEAPAKYRNKHKQTARKIAAQGKVQLPQLPSEALKPTRKAPLPPTKQSGDNSLGVAGDNHSLRSGAYLVSTPSYTEMEDSIYTNQWVSEELEANKRRMENQNKRVSYLSLFKEDAATNLNRFRRWADSVKTRIADSGRSYENQDVIQEMHDSYQRNVNNRPNIRNQQNANNQRNGIAPHHAHIPQMEINNQEDNINLSDELKERLKLRRMKAERY